MCVVLTYQKCAVIYLIFYHKFVVFEVNGIILDPTIVQCLWLAPKVLETQLRCTGLDDDKCKYIGI